MKTPSLFFAAAVAATVIGSAAVAGTSTIGLLPSLQFKAEQASATKNATPQSYVCVPGEAKADTQTGVCATPTGSNAKN